MHEWEKDWVVTLAAATILFLLLALFLVSFVLLFQKRKLNHRYEIEQLKQAFQKTLLTTQNEIQEQVLRNISQELHDNISQQLGLIKLQLTQVQRQNPLIDLSDTNHVIANTISDIRALSKSLHPDRIATAPITDSILVELSLAKRASDITITHDITLQDDVFLPEQKIIFFRIFQELFNNALKHSNATQIEIACHTGKNIVLAVKDDGTGLPADYKSSIGHSGIYQRAGALNGTFTIESSPGKGTMASVQIPLPDF